MSKIPLPPSESLHPGGEMDERLRRKMCYWGGWAQEYWAQGFLEEGASELRPTEGEELARKKERECPKQRGQNMQRKGKGSGLHSRT